jgi:phospholipid/cholesterol/gamma-HCH transport system permease protein
MNVGELQLNMPGVWAHIPVDEAVANTETVGALVCVSSVMEIAPIFVSFAIASQAGTAMTAELAHMQITEQISAMRLSKVDPINYLISTRLCAAIYVLPLIIIAGAFFSILGGLIVAKFQAGIEFGIFLDSVWRSLKLKDIWYSVIKGFFFANYIIAVHTTFGLGARGGAKEVGMMTSTSTIWVTVGIICINALLDYFMYLD